jgi:hypothetical protein
VALTLKAGLCVGQVGPTAEETRRPQEAAAPAYLKRRIGGSSADARPLPHVSMNGPPRKLPCRRGATGDRRRARRTAEVVDYAIQRLDSALFRELAGLIGP